MNGVGDWLTASLAFGTAILAAAWLLSLGMRSRSAKFENAAWRMTLLVLLLAPLLIAFGNQFPRRQLWVSTPSSWAAPASMPWLDAPIRIVPILTQLVRVKKNPAPTISAAENFKHDSVLNPWAVLIGIWLLGTSIFLLRLFAGIRRNRALLQRAQPADTAWTGELHDLARDLGIPPPRLLASDEITSPYLVGFRQPSILVPKAAGRPSREVLSHELAHLRRHDLWWMLMGRVAVAIWFFHPLSWIALRRLERSAEEVCDDFVVLRTGNPHVYAAQLVDYARNQSSSHEARFVGIGMAAFHSMLGKRVRRILTPARRLSDRIGPFGASTIGLASLLVAGIAMILRVGNVEAALPEKPGDGSRMVLEEIKFQPVGAAVMNSEEMLKVMKLKQDGPIFDLTLNDALKRLFETGRFENLRYSVKTKENAFLVTVIYEGAARLHKAELRSPLESGANLSLMSGTWTARVLALPQNDAARQIDEYVIWKDARQIEKNAEAQGIHHAAVSYELQRTPHRESLANVLFKVQLPKK